MTNWVLGIKINKEVGLISMLRSFKDDILIKGEVTQMPTEKEESTKFPPSINKKRLG